MTDLADRRELKTPGLHGVRGWLLLLCVMFTIVGPIIAIGLMLRDYAMFAPIFAEHGGLEAADLFTIAIRAFSVAYGIYAGVRLWAVRPGAVETAKLALLIGLAADVVTSLLLVIAGPTPIAEAGLAHPSFTRVLPDLVFFTLCFGYLNKSRRVEATYGS